jgi:hypothetical protein
MSTNDQYLMKATRGGQEIEIPKHEIQPGDRIQFAVPSQIGKVQYTGTEGGRWKVQGNSLGTFARPRPWNFHPEDLVVNSEGYLVDTTHSSARDSPGIVPHSLRPNGPRIK